MGPRAGNAEGGGCEGGDELLGSRVQVLHVGLGMLKLSSLGGVFVTTTSRLGTLA